MPRDLNSKKQSNGLPPDGVILKWEGLAERNSIPWNIIVEHSR